ncbi:MAG: YbaB/EbfC family nucleoid-associated protein [Bauldia sp.]|nr:YbaB/EbfC family nucleoid-associated protein [Bauldia sp.]
MRDLMGMMKQAKQLQSKMQEVQERIAAVEVSGTSGGGLVSVTLMGKGDMKGLRVDPSLLKADEAEILEDLIVAAHNDARQKLENRTAEMMQELTGGLSLPPGMKLPF